MNISISISIAACCRRASAPGGGGGAVEWSTVNKSPLVTVSGGGLTISTEMDDGWQGAASNTPVGAGLKSFTVIADGAMGLFGAGVGNGSVSYGDSPGYNGTNSVGYASYGDIELDGNLLATAAPFVVGDIITISYNKATGMLGVSVNGGSVTSVSVGNFGGGNVYALGYCGGAGSLMANFDTWA